MAHPVLVHVEPSHEGKHVAHDSSAETESEERVSHVWVAAFETVIDNCRHGGADEPVGSR